MPRTQPEAIIQRRILAALAAAFHPHGIFWPHPTGMAWTRDGKRPIRYGLPGSSDIVGCLAGRWVGIEVKTETGKQRDAQIAFQRVIEVAGGIYIVARSPEEAVDQLRARIEDAGAGTNSTTSVQPKDLSAMKSDIASRTKASTSSRRKPGAQNCPTST